MKKRSWSEKDLRSVVPQCRSIRQVLLALGLKPAGGNYSQISKYLSIYKVEISHFKGRAWNKGLKGIRQPRFSLKEILVKNSDFQSYRLKNRLINAGLKPSCCEECGWAKKSVDGRLPLEIDHINGNKRDNRIENLRILCPNCHSLKSTHRGSNSNKELSRGGGIARHERLKIS